MGYHTEWVASARCLPDQGKGYPGLINDHMTMWARHHFRMSSILLPSFRQSPHPNNSRAPSFMSARVAAANHLRQIELLGGSSRPAELYGASLIRQWHTVSSLLVRVGCLYTFPAWRRWVMPIGSGHRQQNERFPSGAEQSCLRS